METEAEVPVSEGEGRCRFEDLRMELEGGPSTLWVDHPEYAFAFLSVDPIQGGENREIEVALPRGETLEGRVTDWEGKPVPGAWVQVRGPDRYGKWHPDLGKTAICAGMREMGSYISRRHSMRTHKTLWGAALAAMIVMSCGCDSSSPTDSDEPSEPIVDPSGGTVHLLEDEIVIDVPPDALSESLTFTVEKVLSIPKAGQLRPVGEGLRLGPEGASFAKSVTLTFSYSELVLVPGTSEEDLQLFTYLEKEGYWQTLPSTVDTSNNTISTTVERLGLFVRGRDIAPMPVQVESMEASYTSVVLSWDPNGDADFAEYRIYYGAPGKVDEDAMLAATLEDQETDNFTVTGLESGVEYGFRVYVVDRKGLSRGSEEVRIWTELNVDLATGEIGVFGLPGGVEIDMVWIEPGTFMMGADPYRQSGDLFENALPRHEVAISRGFYLGKYELTQGQWESVMGTRPWAGEVGSYLKEGPNYPAVYMYREEAQAFVDSLNAAEGSEVYRLPTEAEWEYACRAGTTTLWSFGGLFGNYESLIAEYAWCRENTVDVGEKEMHAHEVGLKLPSPWGLYDMHGNVEEWVYDCYDADYYSISPGMDPTGPSSSEGCIPLARGGAWGTDRSQTTSAYRGRELGRHGPLRTVVRGMRLLRQRP